MTFRPLIGRLLLVTLCLAVPRPTEAVSDGAPQSRAMLLVGSARANGMGEMTTILDDGPVALWWNPGMLALDRRARAERTWSELAKGLADDIELRTTSVSGGWSDGPVRFAVGFGFGELDLGSSDIISEDGELLGEFESGDELINLVLGASLYDAFSAGIAYEQTISDLTPPIEELGIEDGRVSVRSHSVGFVLSPRFIWIIPDGAGDSAAFRFGRDALRRNPSPGSVHVYMNPIAAVSWLHLGGADVVYNPMNEPEDLPRQRHVGWGFRFGFEARDPDRFLDWRRFLSMDVLFGQERAKNLLGGDVIDHRGVEIRICHVFSIRRGRVDDPEGRIQANTRGYGISLEEFLPFGLRYDYAEIPQASDLPKVERHAFSLSVDIDRLLGR